MNMKYALRSEDTEQMGVIAWCSWKRQQYPELALLHHCPKCGREIDIEKDMYLPERDWCPTLYDPDSGGDPISIHCQCGIEFCAATHDWEEFAAAWNERA